MRDLRASKTLTWSLLAAFVLITLYMLGVRTLVPHAEGRYATMAHDMFACGDWITARLNRIEYFEKPPLQTWMSALSCSSSTPAVNWTGRPPREWPMPCATSSTPTAARSRRPGRW
jgi:4-amino-4-deoxy-L-arabinose transferase-like glycosyltransferase